MELPRGSGTGMLSRRKEKAELRPMLLVLPSRFVETLWAYCYLAVAL